MLVILSPTFVEGRTTYIYKGNEYTECQGSYCSGGPYALSIEFVTTLDGNELVDLPFTKISSTVTSFIFTDGSGLTIDQNTHGACGRFEISTDEWGRIDTWLIGASANNYQIQMQTNWNTQYRFQPGLDFL